MFFAFHQNNSDGRFTAPAVNVIIEADSPSDANSRAESLGLYWDGVERGLDCSCCGDRWSPQWEEDGDKVPSIYGMPVEEWASKDAFIAWGTKQVPDARVYYKDGSTADFLLS